MTDRHLTRTAVFVLLERDEKYFFLRRANTGWSDGLLTLPSGHVDQGSFVREAAVAEAKEESCVDIDADSLKLIHVDYLRDEYINFYFKAREWKGEPALGEPDLASEAMWISKNNLPDDMIPQLHNFFKELELGNIFSEMSR